jgi:hypothetical protein
VVTLSDRARKPSKIRSYNSIRKSNLINIPLEKNNDKPKHAKPLPNVMLLNARSLINKIDELEIVVGKNDIDIVCISETWFKETVPDEAVTCSGMTLGRTYGTGGGVALYVNSKIPFKIRKDLHDRSFECQWVTLRPKWLPRVISKIAVCCVLYHLVKVRQTVFMITFINCYDKLCTESPNK